MLGPAFLGHGLGGGGGGTGDCPVPGDVRYGVPYCDGEVGTLVVSLADPMPGILGQNSVALDLAAAQQDDTVVTGNIKHPDATTQAWAHLKIWPRAANAGTGEDRAPTEHTTITLWRWGETFAPKTNDQIIPSAGKDSGKKFQVVEVTSIYDEDEASNYCVYETKCTRKPS